LLKRSIRRSAFRSLSRESGNLAHALGADTLETLSRQTGIERDELLNGLSQYLPRLVDHLTPDGKIPNADEAQRMV
jgi:uncharacterized protein YidB (DUF937 family)